MNSYNFIIETIYGMYLEGDDPLILEKIGIHGVPYTYCDSKLLTFFENHPKIGIKKIKQYRLDDFHNPPELPDIIFFLNDIEFLGVERWALFGMENPPIIPLPLLNLKYENITPKTIKYFLYN